MGFTPRGKVYVLDFTDDPELDGLEVRTRSASIGSVLDMARLAARATTEAGASPADIEQLLDGMAAALDSWNLELRPGVPTPADRDGLRQMDPRQFLRLVTTWVEAVSDAPAPLPQPSSSGAPSLEGSLPMEPLSPSLAS